MLSSLHLDLWRKIMAYFDSSRSISDGVWSKTKNNYRRGIPAAGVGLTAFAFVTDPELFANRPVAILIIVTATAYSLLKWAEKSFSKATD